MLRRYKPFALALALTALLAGCAQAPEPGVRLRSVSTELGLGLVKDVKKESLPPLPPLGEFPSAPPVRGQSQPPKPVCPQAGLFEFADAEAGPTVSNPPELGRYRWKYKLNVLDPKAAERWVGGANRFLLGDELRKGIVEFFGARTVDTLAPDIAESATTIATDQFQRGSYQYTVGELFGVSPWPTVNNLGGGDRFRIQPGSYADTGNTQRDEGEGISVFFTAWGEASNIKDRSTYRSWLMAWGGASGTGPVNTNAPDAPQTAAGHLQLVHFPISAGQTITSYARGAAVDPSIIGANPGAITNMGPRYDVLFEGKVVGRRQVDACGEMVDGWYVDGKLTTIRDGGAATVFDYDFEVATQMGGLIIYQRWAMQSEPLVDYTAQKPAFVIEASIAQAKPSTD